MAVPQRQALRCQCLAAQSLCAVPIALQLAFIEANGEVGDPQEKYVGKAFHGACQVVDAVGEFVGEFDPGRGYVKDAQGSVIAEISKEGSIKNNAGQGVGVFEGFSYELMPTIAAYFLLVDPSFLTSRHGIGVAR